MTATEYRTIRKQLGLTQAGLAAILGETRETINRREKGLTISGRDEFALLWIAHQNTKMSIHDLLARAEIDYRDAVLEYDKAEEEGVSSFHEHNTCSYLKGVCDAYRNLLNQNND
jgi:transcriptional regulator with XRE-family HTH domain